MCLWTRNLLSAVNSRAPARPFCRFWGTCSNAHGHLENWLWSACCGLGLAHTRAIAQAASGGLDHMCLLTLASEGERLRLVPFRRLQFS